MVIPSRGFSRVQRMRSDSVELEVLPAVAPPPEFAGAAWLPAANLTLTETWTDGNAAFSLGVPRTRTLTIAADGLLETQLPELRLGPAAGIRQYPDQPELEREVTDAGLKARRVERYAVIAQVAGTASIPAAELPWWNVLSERWEIARVEPQSYPVQPGNEPTLAQPALPSGEPAILETDEAAPNYWPVISTVLGVAWITTILLWLRSRSGGIWPRIDGAPKKPGRKPATATPSSRRVLKQLRAACAATDAARAQRLLLEWAKLQFGPEPPHSLGALCDRLPEPLAAQVGMLEAHLYGPAGKPWNGAELAALLADLDSVEGVSGKDGADPLVPLYR
jgi:hypothetical protein